MKMLPSFDAKRHLAADKQVGEWLSRREGRVLGRTSARVTARLASRILKGGSPGRTDVLTEIFESFRDRELDACDIRRLTELTVAADYFVREGGWSPWNPAGKPVAAPLFLDSVAPLGKRMYACTLTAHGGPPAGCRWHPVLPGGLLQVIIRNCGGLKWGGYRDADAGGLWFFATVDGRGRIRRPLASRSQARLNRGLLDARGGACEKGIRKKCGNCHLGRGQCPLSRHAEPYERGLCMLSPEHEGWLVSGGVCLKCLEKGRYFQK